MSDYFAKLLGEEMCAWIRNSGSFVFGDVIAYALLDIDYKGIVYIFITEDHLEEFSEKFPETDAKVLPILMTETLERILDLQPFSFLRCWFNGEKIVGNYLRQTRNREVILFPDSSDNMPVLPQEYVDMKFKIVEKKPQPQKVKHLPLRERLLLDKRMMSFLTARLREDSWFKTKTVDIKEEDLNQTALDMMIKATSVRDGYTLWVLESYLNGGIRSLEDLGTVKNSLKSFTELTSRVDFDTLRDEKGFTEFKDIGRYCGLVGCNWSRLVEISEAFQSLKRDKCNSKTCGLSLSELLMRHGGEKKTGFLEKISEEEMENVVFENGSAYVVHLPSEESAKCWGKGTQWCTAADSNNMFGHYKSQGPLYMIVDKIDPYRKRYQLHFESQQFMKIDDTPIPLEELMKLYPSIIVQRVLKQKGPKWKPDLIEKRQTMLMPNVVINDVFDVPGYFRHGDFVVSRYNYENGKLFVTEDLPPDLTEVTEIISETDIRSFYGLDVSKLKSISCHSLYADMTGLNLEALESLRFKTYYDGSFVGGRCPLLKILNLNGYTQSFEGVDFPSLEVLMLGDYTNSLSTLNFPKLRELSIGIPDRYGGTTLKRGNVKRHQNELVSVDLSKLEKLTILYRCDQSLRGVNLRSLKMLHLVSGYVHRIPDGLVSLETLEVGTYDPDFDSITMPSLKHLIVKKLQGKSLSALTSLETLIVDRIPEVLPASLRVLTVTENSEYKGTNLRQITELRLLCDVHRSFVSADLSNLKVLHINTRRGTDLSGLRVPELRVLNLSRFSHPIPNKMPKLEELTIATDSSSGAFGGFNHPLPKGMRSLRTLECGSWFDRPLPDDLVSLVSLKIPSQRYSHALPPLSSLKSLTMWKYTPHMVEDDPWTKTRKEHSRKEMYDAIEELTLLGDVNSIPEMMNSLKRLTIVGHVGEDVFRRINLKGLEYLSTPKSIYMPSDLPNVTEMHTYTPYEGFTGKFPKLRTMVCFGGAEFRDAELPLLTELVVNGGTHRKVELINTLLPSLHKLTVKSCILGELKIDSLEELHVNESKEIVVGSNFRNLKRLVAHGCVEFPPGLEYLEVSADTVDLTELESRRIQIKVD